jgi:predicted small secreted protein
LLNTNLRSARTVVMRKPLSIAFTLLLLLSAVPVLTACHTTAGAGEDISDAGHAISHDANKATP